MKIGAAWNKESESGVKFKSCVISIPIIGTLNFAMFGVDDKKSDSAPDFKIVYDNKEIGSGWIKEKDDKKWLSCNVHLLGMKNDLNFAVFANDKKEEDRHPDYNIVWSDYSADNSDGLGF